MLTTHPAPKQKKNLRPRVHRTMHNGRECFYFHVPATVAGGKRVRRFFPVGDKQAAKDMEGELTQIEHALKGWRDGYSGLTVHEQARIGKILKRLVEKFKDADPIDELGRAVDEHIERAPSHRLTVVDLRDEFLKDQARRKNSKQHIRGLRCTLKNFSARFGHKLIVDLEMKLIQSWLHEEEYADESRKTLLRGVNSMLNYAVDHGYLERNPAKLIEPPKIRGRKKALLSPVDAERLLRACEATDPALIPYVALIMFGGLRPDEAMRSRKEFIVDGVLRLPEGRTKNNRARLVEINRLETLKAWLDAAPEAWVMSNLRKRLVAVRRSIEPEIEWGHDIIRKSFVSYGTATWGRSKTALRADHSEKVLEAHYRTLASEADAEKFWAIRPKDL